MAELRAGGLAIIVGAASNFGRKYIGTTVCLIRRTNATHPSSGKLGVCWVVSGRARSINGDGSEVYCAEGHLMPIGGDDFTHEDERERELVNG